MWQILFCNFAAYKKINLGNAGRMTLYISPVCCERKNKDTWRHSHNKTVIYYLFFCCCHWLKTRIVWTAHYKGIVKIFSPRLSDHFHTVHLACTRYLLQMKEQKKREAHLPKKKRWLIVQLPSNLVLSHRERCRWPADSKRRQRRHKRCNCRQDIP